MNQSFIFWWDCSCEFWMNNFRWINHNGMQWRCSLRNSSMVMYAFVNEFIFFALINIKILVNQSDIFGNVNIPLSLMKMRQIFKFIVLTWLLCWILASCRYLFETILITILNSIQKKKLNHILWVSYIENVHDKGTWRALDVVIQRNIQVYIWI